MNVEHWSSPNGCHPDCPACELEEEKHECDNCGAEWNGLQLDEICDLTQGIDPGCPVPSGQCPECGALCYLAQSEINGSYRNGIPTFVVERAKAALLGDSNDDEHDALWALMQYIDPEFEIPDPGDKE